ncbi:MAG: helix-turn-helix domain-containing protein, partial [Lachnospiraceae bacterium]
KVGNFLRQKWVFLLCHSQFDSLREYLKNDCDLKKTADVLFVHVNTLRYRLDKAESLLGVSLKEFRNLYELKVASDIYEHLNGIHNVSSEIKRVSD